MPKLMQVGDRKLVEIPISLPNTGTSGSLPITVPFAAAYIGVINPTIATLNYAIGRRGQVSPDAVQVASGVYLSLPIQESTELTLFWSATSQIPTNNNQIILIFSNEEIVISGGVMAQGGVASNVSVTNVPQVTFAAGSTVGVTSLPAGLAQDATLQNVAKDATLQNVAKDATVAKLPKASTAGIVGSTQVSVGTAATAIVNAVVNGNHLSIKNNDASATLYIGAAGVTTATGYPLGAQQSYEMDIASGSTIVVYGITAAGTIQVGTLTTN